MKKYLHTPRIVCIVILMAVLLSIYTSALYELQIKEGDSYLEASRNAIAMVKTVPAARGSILDRNGEVMVYSRTVYNIIINRSILMRDDSPNSVILELCNVCEANNISYTDTFPVTKIGPFSYVADMNDTQRSRLSTYLEYFELDKEISASDLISWMREHYDIDYTLGINDARKIIGVRYEMECRLIMTLSDYLFVEDADTDTISIIIEQGLPGVEVNVTSKREYTTPYASHLLGYLGKMNDTEYEENKDKEGYGVNTDIGKDGVEEAFEEYLHGIDGSITLTTDSQGNVTGILEETPAVSGQNVYLTIDLELQAAAEEALKATIEDINAGREEDEKVGGGAVVVRDVNSGDVLALASYPTYDLETFGENYTELSNDPSEPLFNRATMGKYNPGSTFKMVTAFAAFKEGALTTSTRIEDKGIFTKYDTYQPKCWVYPQSNHGIVGIVEALENSCNYFFYVLGDTIGIDPIAEAAQEFGFGSKTGIEISETEGTLATREYKKEELNEGWWAADTLITAIGQGHNMFTPLQLANYIAAIANDGTVYSTTLLKYVKSADYTETVYEGETGVLNVIDDPNGYLSVLRQGMRAVAKTGTASSVFSDYPVEVAAKTGTVQTDTSASNTGVFVCYAPYDNPEISIAVVVENGGSGSALMSVAKSVLDVYFADDTYEASSYGEYSLIR